jgi:CBS domain-containing protein
VAKRVNEIMNHELFCVVPDDTASEVRGYFYVMGIAAAPVVDEDGRPIGFLSLRDLLDADDNNPVSECMTRDADTIPESALITEAAERMAELGRHHLAAVGEGGRVVGYIGSLDVIRGLLGKPVPHPDSFPHYDESLGITWTDDLDLTMDNAGEAPDGPGFVRLVRIRPGEYDRVVWSEASRNVRTRVLQFMAETPKHMPHLVDELERGQLRFRAAGAPDFASLSRGMKASSSPLPRGASK